MYVLNRLTKKKEEEKIYKEKLLLFLYSKSPFAKAFLFLVRLPFVSSLFALWQKREASSASIKPFIERFAIDTSEFEKETFSSFDEFFSRKIKPRPIAPGEEVAILPADGRYLIFSDLEKDFFVKDKKFDLASFLQDEELAKRYEKGILVLARLSPMDYHRFHFPFDCVPKASKRINGYLYSVHPLALQRNYKILSENKRFLTTLLSPLFGEVLYAEIGATNVGSIKQTFIPDRLYKKGEEKGYFGLGGSSIVLLFQQDRIQIDRDLLAASSLGIEVLGKMGQSLGRAFKKTCS